VPAIDEYLPGYEAISRVGIGAPANTPAEILAILKLPNRRLPLLIRFFEARSPRAVRNFASANC